MQQEAITTRKMLERIPDDKFDWKPHKKSMDIRTLATHIAEIPGWVPMTLDTSELDFAKSNYKPVELHSTKELLAYFEKIQQEACERLSKATEDELLPDWTMRNGDEIYFTQPKDEVLRMCYCQVVHHRAQLGVFLRLLNIPIPGSYGPSADELEMMQAKV